MGHDFQIEWEQYSRDVNSAEKENHFTEPSNYNDLQQRLIIWRSLDCLWNILQSKNQ
jgi:hypothetical protein